jgi:hypothetical protein
VWQGNWLLGGVTLRWLSQHRMLGGVMGVVAGFMSAGQGGGWVGQSGLVVWAQG